MHVYLLQLPGPLVVMAEILNKLDVASSCSRRLRAVVVFFDGVYDYRRDKCILMQSRNINLVLRMELPWRRLAEKLLLLLWGLRNRSELLNSSQFVISVIV